MRAVAEDHPDRAGARRTRPGFDEDPDSVAIGTLDDGGEIDRGQRLRHDRLGRRLAVRDVRLSPPRAVESKARRRCRFQSVEGSIGVFHFPRDFAMHGADDRERQERSADGLDQSFERGRLSADHDFIRRVDD